MLEDVLRDDDIEFAVPVGQSRQILAPDAGPLGTRCDVRPEVRVGVTLASTLKPRGPSRCRPELVDARSTPIRDAFVENQNECSTTGLRPAS
jgi:hypothetical protein